MNSRDRRQGIIVVNVLPVLDECRQDQLGMVKDGQRVGGGFFTVGPNSYTTGKIYAKEPFTSL